MRGSIGPVRPVPPAVIPPRGQKVVAEFGKTPWRSTTGNSLIGLGLVIILLSASLYARAPSEWFSDLLLAAFGLALILSVIIVSRMMRPQLPPQKD